MTTFTGTIKYGGSAIGSSYFPADWTVVDVDYDIDGDSWSLAATAVVQSDATFSLNSPDAADREVRLVACQPLGKPWSGGESISGAGVYRHKSSGFDGVVFRSDGSGTTGASEPSWNTTHGNTTADNGITWTAVDYLSMSDTQGPHINVEYAARSFAGYMAYLNPTSWWRLGEASGTTAADEQGLNDGTYSGSPTLGAAGLVDGDSDTCVNFDGTNDYVDLSGATTQYCNESGDFSIHVLMNFTGSFTGGFYLGICSFKGASEAVRVAVSNDGSYSDIFFGTQSGGRKRISLGGAATGRRSLIITFENGVGYKAYLDGSPQTLLSAGSFGAEPNATYIGTYNGTSAFFTGKADEVAVFTGKVLTAAEAAALSAAAGL